jgi:hypothetical protein
MKNRKVFAMIVSFLLLQAAVAQDTGAAKEMQKIRDYYSGPELKHIAGQMLLTNKVTGKQVDKVDFEYWIKDKQVFTKMNYIEILSSSNTYIMVNHRTKSIYARPLDQLQGKPVAGFFDAEQLNKLLNTKGTRVNLLKNGAFNKLMISGLSDSRFSDLGITYDVSDNKIRSINAVVSNLPGEDDEHLVLQINYSRTDKTNVTTLPDLFSATRYVEIDKNGKLNYTHNYQSYQKL